MQELPSLEELIITVDECVNLVDIGDVVSIVPRKKQFEVN
jgi:hypothetical protein